MSTEIVSTEEKWNIISTDWFQQTSQSNARFCIEKKEQKRGSRHYSSWVFHVCVDKKPVLHPLKMSPQTYYEGLWEYDVAEWFIVNPITGKYIELNLAPTGAWWMMVFDAPRQRAADDMSDLRGIKIENECATKSWSASLEIPVLMIENILGRDVLKYNVCFILGDSPREYLSQTVLNAVQPDFHRPDDFVSLLG